ncbi:MAG: redox-regulated ATPase YchF [Candidatus Uhrbacteria bacterium]
MALQIGIVGLPNVGKSTLFSAITKKQVDCANYPFCTIDPNVGVVEVPDPRLAVLAKISQTKKIVPTVIEFVDIAGLVKGASEGQGLGNKFLANIRETHAIAQVVRAFDDSNILHVDGSINPVRDAETINTELALADLDVLAKRSSTIEKQMKSGRTKDLELELAGVQKAIASLDAGTMLRDVEWTEEERFALRVLQLLTMKPMLYVVNVSEAQLADGSWKARIADLKGRIVPVCVKMEADLSTMSPEEKAEYLEMAGQTKSGLDVLITEAYDVLGLITFLTTGEIETRAWTTTKGSTAPQAAGEIHTDFIKNFIRAEITPYKDFVECGSEAACREKGKTRIEGKDYIMQDGDVCYFRIGA